MVNLKRLLILFRSREGQTRQVEGEDESGAGGFVKFKVLTQIFYFCLISLLVEFVAISDILILDKYIYWRFVPNHKIKDLLENGFLLIFQDPLI